MQRRTNNEWLFAGSGPKSFCNVNEAHILDVLWDLGYPKVTKFQFEFVQTVIQRTNLQWVVICWQWPEIVL